MASSCKLARACKRFQLVFAQQQQQQQQQQRANYNAP